MVLKNFFNKKNRRYNQYKQRANTSNTKSSNFYKRQLIKVIICFVIVGLVILIDKVDTKPTNQAIKLVDKVVSYNFNFKEDGKEIVMYVKEIEIIPQKIKATFSKNEQDNIVQQNTTQEDECVCPVSGEIYIKYGKIEKTNGVEIFNKGIDIDAKNEYIVSISKGRVIENGNSAIYGKYIRINHGDVIAYYSGIKDFYVSKGDIVSKGEKIGSLKTEKFHFEIWKDGEPIDPMKKINIISENTIPE